MTLINILTDDKVPENEFTFNHSEMLSWLGMMRVIAKNLQVSTESLVEELLRHAQGDELSNEDRRFCIEALKYLRKIN